MRGDGNQLTHLLWLSTVAGLTQINLSSNLQDKNINKSFLRLVKDEMF